MMVNPNVKKNHHSNIGEEAKQQNHGHHKATKMKKQQKNCNGDSNKGQEGHKGKSKHKELNDPIVEEGRR